MFVEPVVVRAFRDVALARWLIGETGAVAIITDESGAEAVRRGQAPEFALGFPKVDVFVPSDGASLDEISRNWAGMRRRF